MAPTTRMINENDDDHHHHDNDWNDDTLANDDDGDDDITFEFSRRASAPEESREIISASVWTFPHSWMVRLVLSDDDHGGGHRHHQLFVGQVHICHVTGTYSCVCHNTSPIDHPSRPCHDINIAISNISSIAQCLHIWYLAGCSCHHALDQYCIRGRWNISNTNVASHLILVGSVMLHINTTPGAEVLATRYINITPE